MLISTNNCLVIRRGYARFVVLRLIKPRAPVESGNGFGRAGIEVNLLIESVRRIRIKTLAVIEPARAPMGRSCIFVLGEMLCEISVIRNSLRVIARQKVHVSTGKKRFS